MKYLPLLAVLIASPALAQPSRQMEKLGRGVVAVPTNDGKRLVSWRLLATDAPGVAFNVYRESNGKARKLNAAPLKAATCLADANVAEGAKYFVRAVASGREGAASTSYAPQAGGKPYHSIALQTPEGYAPNDASAADLDGDGEYEIVLHQAGRARDNSQNGETDPPILQAYTLGGRLLWTINLGRNIREGAHYTQFMAFDLDGDGRAEIACKTADGTRDGTGKVIGDANADFRDASGRILRGPEYFTIFDGRTGASLATAPYVPGRHPDKTDPTGDEMKAVWGDAYGNRGDRFLACVAYLDGRLPSVVMCRGYYTRTVLAAWNWRGGKLSNVWTFDSATPGNEKYAGQGNHNLSVADVDGDGRDEIVYGKMALDDNGRGLYSTGIGHGDAMHLFDIVPERPGLEVFSIQEPFADAGAHVFDARTGEVLWKKPSTQSRPGAKVEGPGRGLALDIDPRYAGAESWAAGAGLSGQMWDARGNQIANTTPSVNMAAYWDGDTLRELLDGTRIDKWNWLGSKPEVLLDARAFGCASNNGTKANSCLSADLWGDWREEVVWRSEDNRELRIFSTPIPTGKRFVTLMHDPVYRLGVAWQNAGYNQPPHAPSVR